MKDLFDTATLWAEKQFPEADPDAIAAFADGYQRYCQDAADQWGDKPPTPEAFYVAGEYELD